MRVLSGVALDLATHKKTSARGRDRQRAQDRPMRNRLVGRGAPLVHQNQPPGRLDAIEAKVSNEIVVMQGIMICELRQNEHLVRLEAKEVRGSLRCASVNPEYTPSQ